MKKKTKAETCCFASIRKYQGNKGIIQGVAQYSKITETSKSYIVTLDSGLLFNSEMGENGLPKSKSLSDFIYIGFGTTKEDALISLVGEMAKN